MGLKVTITPEGGTTPITICDSPDPLPSFGFTINRRSLLRLQPIFRAEYQSVFDHGNRLNRIGFSVFRSKDGSGQEFTNSVQSLTFAMDHPETLPVKGVATFTLSDGAATAQRKMSVLGVESFEMTRHKGASLWLRYELVGGAITT